MFPMSAALMHRRLERAVDRFGARSCPAGGGRTLDVRRPRRPQQRLRPPPRRPGRHHRRPGRGHDLQPGRVPGGRQRRSASWARPPSCSARPGRPSRSATPSTSPPPATPSPRPPPRPLLAEHLGAGAVTDLDDAATDRGDRGPEHRPGAPARRGRGRRGHPRVQLGHDRAAQGRAPHPRLDGGGHHRTGSPRWASAPTTGSRWPRPPSHILGLLNLLAAAEAGATVRLHRRFDLDEVLRRIERRAHDAGDGGGPHRPGPGQPPPPRVLRPLLAALHHVGRHPGDRERGRAP